MKKVKAYPDGTVRGIFNPKGHEELATAAFDMVTAGLISSQMAAKIITEIRRRQKCGEPSYDPERNTL
jgi:hypothetical protein